jgi:hypothetical protein
VAKVTSTGSWDYDDLLISATAPHIVSQPTNLTVALGATTNLSVAATGAPTLLYQWRFNNADLPDATNSAIVLPDVQGSDAGAYQVVLSNYYGAVTSSIAMVSVTGVAAGFSGGPGALQLNNGQFRLSLTGLTGQGNVEIDASTNLLQWVPIFTNPSSFGTATFIDSNASNFPERFYRTKTP